MARKRYPIPSDAEKRKIKRALGIPLHHPFPRCQGKSVKRVRKLAAEGDLSHKAEDHLCDDCRCGCVAGQGTDHYGVGYCIGHETDVRYMHHAEKMMDEQIVAIRQGYPDRVYRYEDQSKYLAKIRKAAEDAGGMTDLREELNFLRTKLQDLASTFEKRRELTEGYGPDGEPRLMTDATYMKLVTQLTKAIADISKQNLAITESDYIHVDQMKIWFSQVLSIIERHVMSAEEYQRVVEDIKLVPAPKVGRK